MSTIFRDIKGKGIDDISRAYEDATCHVCGQRKADAMWMCIGGDIFVCYWCALDTLPALIADAMRARRDVKDVLIDTHRKMDQVFWRAAALALSREPVAADVAEFEQRQIMERVYFEIAREQAD